jgi:phosphoribosylformimino-5-aminoimidazole carboxamide ribotide isomerase
MIVYPAIDLKDGRCVRLKQGDMAQATVYGDDPAAMALTFQRQGARWLHVVDLDGAFAGESRNLEAIRAILAAVAMPVQLGGGIRTMAALDTLLGLGLSRAILGTAALRDPDFLRQAVEAFGAKVAVGIDAREGRVAVGGWAEVSDMPAAELAARVANLGVRTIIYTDISRDGMLSGPNFDATAQLIRENGPGIIVSGGVATLEHVRRAEQIGAAGIIIGRALYTGDIVLGDLGLGGTPC